MSNPCRSSFFRETWFNLKRLSGTLERQSPALPWTSIAPTAKEQVAFAAKWKSKAPCLPISLLDRNYLAPHLEQYAVALGHSPEAEARAIASGRFRLVSGEFINLGSPPEWNLGQANLTQLHWSKIPTEADSMTVAVNEVSQFNWAYPLVRAWILSGNDAHVETFWNSLEDWMEKNPPNKGPQWVSDEAIARRILAVTYVVQALRFHSSTTDERLSRAAQLISVSAKRLELTQGHAYAQSLLHGLISSLALFTAGALWPQLAAADVWRSEGLEHLINKGKRLINNDNRTTAVVTDAASLILEIYTWAEIILRREAERESLPESLQKNIRIIVSNFIHQRRKGCTQSLLFSLSGCSNSDTLPPLAAALILFTGNGLPAGPWDETSLLLTGPCCVSACTY